MKSSHFTLHAIYPIFYIAFYTNWKSHTNQQHLHLLLQSQVHKPCQALKERVRRNTRFSFAIIEVHIILFTFLMYVQSCGVLIFKSNNKSVYITIFTLAIQLFLFLSLGMLLIKYFLVKFPTSVNQIIKKCHDKLKLHECIMFISKQSVQN